MPAAWELVVSWQGEPIRAELLQGAVRVDAGGPHPDDLPLPIDDRAPLVRREGAALALLPVAGATWTIDGAATTSTGAVALGEGTARLAIGNLEVAVQHTTPAPPFPRFAALGGAALRFATFTAATVLAGLTLYTEPPPPQCFCLLGHDRAIGHAVAKFAERQAPPQVRRTAEIPRWMSSQRPEESARPTRDGRDGDEHTPARPWRRRPDAATPTPSMPDLLSSPMDPTPDLAVATVGLEVIRVDDLADDPPLPPGARFAAGGASGGAGERGDGEGRGGVGSCDAAHFSALVARHGRQTAIIACAPAPELGASSPRRGDNVVLHERDGRGRLAPEVWTWSSRGAPPPAP